MASRYTSKQGAFIRPAPAWPGSPKTWSEGTMNMDLKQWIGKQESVSDLITPTPYAALSATFDREPERPPEGTPLPALWHWLYFLPLYRQSEIGDDGHAKRGGFLPPVPLPRRMWAGGRLTFGHPLRVNDRIERTSRIVD